MRLSRTDKSIQIVRRLTGGLQGLQRWKVKHCFYRYTVSVLPKEQDLETAQPINIAQHNCIHQDGKTVNSIVTYNLNF